MMLSACCNGAEAAQTSRQPTPASSSRGVTGIGGTASRSTRASTCYRSVTSKLGVLCSSIPSRPSQRPSSSPTRTSSRSASSLESSPSLARTCARRSSTHPKSSPPSPLCLTSRTLQARCTSASMPSSSSLSQRSRSTTSTVAASSTSTRGTTPANSGSRPTPSSWKATVQSR